jgi:hypothetical protein
MTKDDNKLTGSPSKYQTFVHLLLVLIKIYSVKVEALTKVYLKPSLEGNVRNI